MKKINIVLFVLLCICIAGCDQPSSENDKNKSKDTLNQVSNELSKHKKFIRNEEPLIKSKSNKSIDIIEFSSFTCSHCADFHKGTLSELKKSNVFDKINYYIIDFPLDYFAFYASRIGRCIGDTRYTYTDIVYSQQDTWKNLFDSSMPESQFEVEKTLINYAVQLGNSEDEILNCIESEKIQNDILNKQISAQEEFGIESTPTFIINGEKVMGNMPSSQFIELLEKKIIC